MGSGAVGSRIRNSNCDGFYQYFSYLLNTFIFHKRISNSLAVRVRESCWDPSDATAHRNYGLVRLVPELSVR